MSSKAAVRSVSQVLKLNGSRAYGKGSVLKQFTMNDLPVPSGSWKIANSIKQRHNNMVLAAGIVIFTSTFGVLTQSGIVDFQRGPLHLIGKDNFEDLQ